MLKQLTHGIRLYPNKAPTTAANPSDYMNTTVPVVAEKYDEVVFTNPKADFHQSLMSAHTSKRKLPYPLSNEQSVAEHFRTYGDEEDVKTMLAAKKFLEGELRKVKDRLLNVDVELEQVKHSLAISKDMGFSTTGAAGVVTTGNAAPAGDVHSGNNAKGGTGGSKSKKSKKKASASDSQPAGKKAKTG